MINNYSLDVECVYTLFYLVGSVKDFPPLLMSKYTILLSTSISCYCLGAKSETEGDHKADSMNTYPSFSWLIHTLDRNLYWHNKKCVAKIFLLAKV